MIPISMPQTCRSKLARQTAAIRVDLVPAMSCRSPTSAQVPLTATASAGSPLTLPEPSSSIRRYLAVIEESG